MMQASPFDCDFDPFCSVAKMEEFQIRFQTELDSQNLSRLWGMLFFPFAEQSESGGSGWLRRPADVREERREH